ncbi:hypothetical protein Nmel_018013 [Mimus melanotis]
MATCEGRHASFLPLLLLGSPGAGNEPWELRGSRLGGSGWGSPVTARRCCNPGGFN